MFCLDVNDDVNVKHESDHRASRLKSVACVTSSEKPRQFCMKSQLILIAGGLSINNQKLVDLLFQP